jgi:hypothetical protein
LYPTNEDFLMTDRNPQDQTQTPDEVSTPPELNTNQDTPTTELPSREYSRLMRELEDEAEFIPRDKRFRRAFVVVASIWLLAVGIYAMPGFLGTDIAIVIAVAVTVAASIGVVDWQTVNEQYRRQIPLRRFVVRVVVVFGLLICYAIMAAVKHLDTDISEYAARERDAFIEAAKGDNAGYQKGLEQLLEARESEKTLQQQVNKLATQHSEDVAALALLEQRQANEAKGFRYQDADGVWIGSGVPNHSNNAYNTRSNEMLAKIGDQATVVAGNQSQLEVQRRALENVQEEIEALETLLDEIDEDVLKAADIEHAIEGAVSKLNVYFTLLFNEQYAAAAWLTTLISIFVSLAADIAIALVVYSQCEAFRLARARSARIERLYQVQAIHELANAARNLTGLSADQPVIRARPLNRSQGAAAQSTNLAGPANTSANPPDSPDVSDFHPEEGDEQPGAVWADMNGNVRSAQYEGGRHDV